MFKRIVFPLALLALAFACIAMQYSAGLHVQAFQFNSDGMYLPVLFADVFAHGGSIRDWYLTPAPYFFPDYPIYAVAYLAGRGAFHQVLVFGLLQLAIATAAIAWIGRACLRAHAVLAAVLVVTTVGALAVRGIEPFLYALTNAYHFGAFLNALALVALWLQREQRARPWQLPCMCALAFAGTLSDSLFLVQAMAPFLVTSALVQRTPRRFTVNAVLPHAAVLAAALLGMASYRLVVSHATRPPAALGLDHLALNAQVLGDALARTCTQMPLLAVVIAAWLAVGLAATVRVLQTGQFGRLPRPLILLLVFSLVAAAGNLAAILLLKNLEVTPRYIIPALTWPIVAAAMLLAHWCSAWFAAAGLSAVAIVVGLMGANALAVAGSTDGEAAAAPVAFACIDQALATGNARHGIASYWDAKRIQAVSRHALTIAQYVEDLTEHRWITSDRFYRPAYDFAIINAANGPAFLLPMAQIIAHNGPPAHTATCGGYTVLVYGQDRLRVQAVATSTAQQAP